MPYSDDSDTTYSLQAREMFPVSLHPDIDRMRFVRAREHGLDRWRAAEYCGAVRGSSNAQNPSVWLECQMRDEEVHCDCGNCEDCGFRDDDDDTYANDQDERPISSALLALIGFRPLERILNRPGRVWSAEVECNGLYVSDVANALQIREESYGSKPRGDCEIIAASDCTCGAEVKVGRIRDGAKGHAHAALNTYEGLRSAGAFCGYNTGHHVHTDATTLTDAGSAAVEAALRASLTFAAACEPALIALAASGYDSHRARANDGGYAGSLRDGVERALRQRSAWHSSNAYNHSEHGGGIPTFEYRLPNGTLEPVRAHAHVAVALGLLDLGERAVLRDSAAHEHVRRATERVASGQPWSAADGAAVLLRALDLHPNSVAALHVAAASSPSAPAQMVAALAIAAA